MLCPWSLASPRSLDSEGGEGGGFRIVEIVLDDAVDAAAAGAAAEAGAEFGEVFYVSRGDHFHVAVFGVADPASEVELAGLAVNEPAEAYPLHASLDEEVKDHGHRQGQFCRWMGGGATVTPIPPAPAPSRRALH